MLVIKEYFDTMEEVLLYLEEAEYVYSRVHQSFASEIGTNGTSFFVELIPVYEHK